MAVNDGELIVCNNNEFVLLVQKCHRIGRKPMLKWSNARVEGLKIRRIGD